MLSFILFYFFLLCFLFFLIVLICHFVIFPADMNTSVNLNLDIIVAEVHPAVPQASLPSEGAEGHMVEAAAAAAAAAGLDSSSLSMSADFLSGGAPTIKPGMNYDQIYL